MTVFRLLLAAVPLVCAMILVARVRDEDSGNLRFLLVLAALLLTVLGVGFGVGAIP